MGVEVNNLELLRTEQNLSISAGERSLRNARNLGLVTCFVKLR